MGKRILLINPWIYDFAAVNMWARPLGLFRIAEYLSQFDCEILFIDCMDIYKKKKKYGTGKYPREIIKKPEILHQIPRHYARYGISIDDFINRLKQTLPLDIILITSIMTYWYPGVVEAINIIKEISPDTTVILGGIYATLFPGHAKEVSRAEYIFQGGIDNEAQCERLKVMIEDAGVRLKRIRDQAPYYRLNLYDSYPFAPLLTSRGCVFNCTYCASKYLHQGFIQYKTEDVLKQIMDLYALGVRDFAFYDDALLANANTHIKIILSDIISSGIEIRFHCPNGLHARFIDDELAYLMSRSGFTTIRLGLETVDEQRQSLTGDKVTTGELERAIGFLKSHGVEGNQIGVYLMYGLPGQSLDEVREGVRYLMGLGVKIHLTEFSPIPHTRCWEGLKGNGIISENIDPLLTNNTVFSYLFSGYDPEEIEDLKLLVKEHNASLQ